ncbi:bridging integrator 2a isoform X1 [Boleophthalmus pectinirostris]|uniref:bridging integrator 2a isoform X1 n=1 Tax=Boleophthalmus pectinirostris TaxID=150288 RepID=UPI0024326878|nr:bridging integrator 2a isoform X1 [Boleophthalmus pectinirostris]XP_055022455.1 bridging integrator 2a isoform X1 [Boleophthalmus pectinirostris]
MAESQSPKGGSNVFARKVQRQLSRGKEKVLQKLGKAEVTRDEEFEQYLQRFYDQQTDGNRIHKDLRTYLNAVRDMREASRRLSQSLFDVYEGDWVGEEDLGAIVEGEDLLWNDFEVKLLDQAIRTMESYVSQFPDVRVRKSNVNTHLETGAFSKHSKSNMEATQFLFLLQEKIAKRGRKLVDYDSAKHHLEALQSAKKRDDVKISKAEEEMNAAKVVYEGINNELKEELPTLHDNRIGCYVSVFLAVSNLRDTFYKEVSSLNQDLHNVISELQAQHPDKQFSVKGIQRYGSLRRTLLSPRAWKASFSEFHRSYNPKPTRFSFKSPEKPKHGTLSRESSSTGVSPQPPIPEHPKLEPPSPEPVDLDSTTGSHGEADSSQSQEAASSSPEKSSPAEDKPEVKEEEEPSESEKKQDDEEKDPGSESSSEADQSCDSVSLEKQLEAADHSPLHIDEEEEEEGIGRALDTPKTNGLENGEVPVRSTPIKDTAVDQADSKSTAV